MAFPAELRIRLHDNVIKSGLARSFDRICIMTSHMPGRLQEHPSLQCKRHYREWSGSIHSRVCGTNATHLLHMPRSFQGLLAVRCDTICFTTTIASISAANSSGVQLQQHCSTVRLRPHPSVSGLQVWSTAYYEHLTALSIGGIACHAPLGLNVGT